MILFDVFTSKSEVVLLQRGIVLDVGANHVPANCFVSLARIR